MYYVIIPPLPAFDSGEPYLDKRSIIAVGSLESLAVLASGRVVNSDAAILACRQDVFLALVRFHVVKGGLADDIVSAGKLHLTVAISLFKRKEMLLIVYFLYFLRFCVIERPLFEQRKRKETNGFTCCSWRNMSDLSAPQETI